MKIPLNKKEILASSSGWVASLLNLLPGLGTGYIYQRRWLPYFLTSGAITIWIGLGIVLQTNNDPTQKEQILGLTGLLLISIVTAIESYLAHKKASKIVEENNIEKEKKTKKGWFSN